MMFAMMFEPFNWTVLYVIFHLFIHDLEYDFGTYPGSHWARGWIEPGQCVNPLHSQHTLIVTHTRYGQSSSTNSSDLHVRETKSGEHEGVSV